MFKFRDNFFLLDNFSRIFTKPTGILISFFLTIGFFVCFTFHSNPVSYRHKNEWGEQLIVHGAYRFVLYFHSVVCAVRPNASNCSVSITQINDSSGFVNLNNYFTCVSLRYYLFYISVLGSFFLLSTSSPSKAYLIFFVLGHRVVWSLRCRSFGGPFIVILCVFRSRYFCQLHHYLFNAIWDCVPKGSFDFWILQCLFCGFCYLSSSDYC